MLHDVFAVPFAEIAPLVSRSTDAARMLASRARRKVQSAPRPTGQRQHRREVVDAFLATARKGDFDALLRLLDPDVTWHLHGPRGSSTQVGATEVLRAARRGDCARMEARRVNVNGEPVIIVWGPRGRPIALMACTVSDCRIVELVSIIDPVRLARMPLPPQ